MVLNPHLSQYFACASSDELQDRIRWLIILEIRTVVDHINTRLPSTKNCLSWISGLDNIITHILKQA